MYQARKNYKDNTLPSQETSDNKENNEKEEKPYPQNDNNEK